jgi:peptidylprolyl isomerase
MENTVKNGDSVSVHYKGSLDNGSVFDSSHNREEPLTFEVGSGQVIPGFEAAVVGMVPGSSKSVTISCDQAYGPRNEEAIQIIPKTTFPPGFPFEVGQTVQGNGKDGQQMTATIVSEDKFTVTLDLNHPLAGKNLNFELDLVNINQ